MYIADLHIHSRFSRATSKDCDAPHLDWWARRKGIQLLGTGDFTHPAWRAELREHLVPAEEGVYTLRNDLRLPSATPGDAPRFVVIGEISSIYKKDGKTRKVHNIILLPSLEAADELSAKLESIGNIRSDGQPILGLDSRDLLELTMETCPDAELIPAHIWTPHFSMFGAFSDFDSIEACFGDMTPYIHAIETGLSSDPPMNWRVSALDRLTLVSNSDAHSPAKLGREANLLETGLSYPELIGQFVLGKDFEELWNFSRKKANTIWTAIATAASVSLQLKQSNTAASALSVEKSLRLAWNIVWKSSPTAQKDFGQDMPNRLNL